MHITFSARGPGAGAVSYFLGKHPSNPFQRETNFGTVEVKFLEYEDDYVKVYITFHANGLDMVKASQYRGLEQYINDREFAVSTIFLTNIRRFIGYVLSRDYENIDTAFDFDVEFGPVSTTMSDEAILNLFEPIGYAAKLEDVRADYSFHVDSGKVVAIHLQKHTDIVTLFRQLFVLIPVMDNYKHHPISDDEAEKLLRYGDGWLETHPNRVFITKRYVRHKAPLVDYVMEQMTPEFERAHDTTELKIRLGDVRYQTFARLIDELDVKEVIDMGAGEGRLVELLVQSTKLREVIACEPTESGLRDMHYKLARWEEAGSLQVKPSILQSSLFYRDERLVNRECMVLCEVIEHIERDRVNQVMSTILRDYKPKHLLISTPNVEYNEVYQMGNGVMRHRDHRFEMTRKEFEDFIAGHASAYGYKFTTRGIGDGHPELGHPTQLAVLTRGE